MPRVFSGAMTANLIQVSAPEHPVVLVEFQHPQLVTPIRIANSNEDVVSNGDTYIACPINVVIPDDFENELPRARLEIDNVGRAVVRWIEQTNGGQNTTVFLRIVQKSNPDVIEYEICTDFRNITVTPTKISGTLGYEDVLNKVSVPILYTRERFPGLY